MSDRQHNDQPTAEELAELRDQACSPELDPLSDEKATKAALLVGDLAWQHAADLGVHHQEAAWGGMSYQAVLDMACWLAHRPDLAPKFEELVSVLRNAQ